ncbi:hypothetical protein ACH5RR_025218 [Cinchona calisaya]|uniref:Uncharacterized protein n=1 Tax=Cinchona calisaya TaxID=153742 RepID=A0ABD2Z040_9GENT
MDHSVAMAAKEMEMDSLIIAAAVGTTSMLCVLISPLISITNPIHADLNSPSAISYVFAVMFAMSTLSPMNGVIIVVSVSLMSICTAPRDQVLNRRCRRLSLRRSAGMEILIIFGPIGPLMIILVI